MADELAQLQEWYLAHCDGEWEHGYGVTIDTLDNPGWRVTINLVDTPLADRPFPPVSELAPADDWISCEVEEATFHGRGGPRMLVRILRIFLNWAAHPPAKGNASSS